MILLNEVHLIMNMSKSSFLFCHVTFQHTITSSVYNKKRTSLSFYTSRTDLVISGTMVSLGWKHDSTEWSGLENSLDLGIPVVK